MTVSPEHIPQVEKTPSVKDLLRDALAIGRSLISTIFHKKTIDQNPILDAAQLRVQQVKQQRIVGHEINNLVGRTAPINLDSNLGTHLASLNDLLKNTDKVHNLSTVRSTVTTAENIEDQEALNRIRSQIEDIAREFSSRTLGLKTDELIGKTITIHEGATTRQVKIAAIEYNQPGMGRAQALSIILSDNGKQIPVSPARLQIMMQTPVNYGPRIVTDEDRVDAYGDGDLNSDKNKAAINTYITECLNNCPSAISYEIKLEREGHRKIEVRNRDGKKYTIHCSLERDPRMGYLLKINKVSGWHTWFSTKFNYYKGQRFTAVELGMILNS